MTESNAIALRAFDFIEQISGLHTVDELLDAFRKEITRFGYTTFALGALPVPGKAELQPFFISDWSEDWIETYVAEGLAPNDWNIAYARTGILPATWTQLRALAADHPEVLRTFDFVADNGWPEGVAIPVHGPNGYRGLVTVAGEQADLAERDRAALHLMALYFHDRLKSIMAPEPDATPGRLPRLSSGEIDCIHWLIAGKTDWEIGEILGIAEATAHWRVEQAKKKLGVKTRAQLTALAVAYGYVRP